MGESKDRWYTHHYLPELADAGLEIDSQWYAHHLLTKNVLHIIYIYLSLFQTSLVAMDHNKQTCG